MVSATVAADNDRAPCVSYTTVMEYVVFFINCKPRYCAARLKCRRSSLLSSFYCNHFRETQVLCILRYRSLLGVIAVYSSVDVRVSGYPCSASLSLRWRWATNHSRRKYMAHFLGATVLGHRGGCGTPVEWLRIASCAFISVLFYAHREPCMARRDVIEVSTDALDRSLVKDK